MATISSPEQVSKENTSSRPTLALAAGIVAAVVAGVLALIATRPSWHVIDRFDSSKPCAAVEGGEYFDSSGGEVRFEWSTSRGEPPLVAIVPPGNKANLSEWPKTAAADLAAGSVIVVPRRAHGHVVLTEHKAGRYWVRYATSGCTRWTYVAREPR